MSSANQKKWLKEKTVCVYQCKDCLKEFSVEIGKVLKNLPFSLMRNLLPY